MKIKATGGRNVAQCCYLRLFTNISSIFTSFYCISLYKCVLSLVTTSCKHTYIDIDRGKLSGTSGSKVEHEQLVATERSAVHH